VTDSVNPFASVPEYQSVNAEIVSTSPETHATRIPQLPTSGVARSGFVDRRSGRIRSGRAGSGSGVCTGAVWAKSGPAGAETGAGSSPAPSGRNTFGR